MFLEALTRADFAIIRLSQKLYNYVLDRWGFLIGSWRANFTLMYLTFLFLTCYIERLNDPSGTAFLVVMMLLAAISSYVYAYRDHMGQENDWHREGKFASLNYISLGYYTRIQSALRLIGNVLFLFFTISGIINGQLSHITAAVALFGIVARNYALCVFVRDRDSTRFQKTSGREAMGTV